MSDSKLKQINQKYIELSKQINESASGNFQKMFANMVKAVEAEYLQELKLYMLERKVEQAQRMFEAEYKQEHYVPAFKKVLWFWKLNPIGEKLIKQLNAELAEYIKNFGEETVKSAEDNPPVEQQETVPPTAIVPIPDAPVEAVECDNVLPPPQPQDLLTANMGLMPQQQGTVTKVTATAVKIEQEFQQQEVQNQTNGE